MGETMAFQIPESARSHPAWFRLEEQLAWYDGKSTYCQRWYKGLKFLQILLGASVPVWAYQDYRAITAVVGVAIAVLEAVQHLNQYATLWVAELEQVAKENLKIGAAPQRRHVFISFASEDLDEVNLLRGQAKNENSSLGFDDFSLKEPFDSENAEYIRRGIRERIRQSSATLVYVSDQAASSKWVDWEIRESLALGKQVFCVYKGSAPPKVLPQAAIENKLSIVPWNHEAIMAELNKGN